MGFRRMREMNIALLGKQGWRFLNRPDSLVARVFRSRYYPGGDFYNAKLGRDSSYVWMNVWEAWGEVQQGVRWRVGTGQIVKIWGDPWLPSRKNPCVITPMFDSIATATVNCLMNDVLDGWDVEILNDLFCERDMNLILKVLISLSKGIDIHYWDGEGNVHYSVKSAYRLLVGESGGVNGGSWTKMWNLHIPPKVKCFFWSLCSNSLPTKVALTLKRVNCGTLCAFCGVERELVAHVFMVCDYAMQGRIGPSHYVFLGYLGGEKQENLAKYVSSSEGGGSFFSGILTGVEVVREFLGGAGMNSGERVEFGMHHLIIY
ncbi:PREDICTED: uncharacterized protein LOC109159818 [Ipomoea nil]|uniref:uncharacterized protein LOC109159818 n=1 Tax=Ipomoea nil TaxID=35883 RepID=UPI0009016039|nr:PREDICTED: uncharacterized protein LOC109159818 [Ipomoea nil]